MDNYDFKYEFYYYSDASSFIIGLFLTDFALNANLMVERVCEKFITAGDKVQMIVVKEFPPNALANIRVNFESL